eukprot:979549-Pyramimonas_sp.AAC.1
MTDQSDAGSVGIFSRRTNRGFCNAGAGDGDGGVFGRPAAAGLVGGTPAQAHDAALLLPPVLRQRVRQGARGPSVCVFGAYHIGTVVVTFHKSWSNRNKI